MSSNFSRLSTKQLVSELDTLGIKLSINGDRLRCDAPKGILTPTLQTELVKYKADIIKFLNDSQAEPDSATQFVRPRLRDKAPPASMLQERQWILSQRDDTIANYGHATQVNEIEGSLDGVALEQAYTELVNRHETLRTTFKIVNGSLVQIIAPPPATMRLPMIDLQEFPAQEQSNQVYQLILEASLWPFDLVKDHLLRVILLRLAEKRYILIQVTHVLICEEISIGIINRDLSVFYSAFLQGKTPSLPEMTVQYADYAVWEREHIAGDTLEKHLHYWKQKLTGVPPLELPTDYPRPTVRTFDSAGYHFQLNPDLLQKLEALSHQTGVTLFMLILAAQATLLFRYSGQDDILIGSPISNRNQKEIEPLVGLFVLFMPLRIDLGGNPTFQELIARVRETIMEALAHRYIPLAELGDHFRSERSSNRQLWYQTMVNYRDLTGMRWHSLDFPNLKITDLIWEQKRTKAAYDDLDLIVHKAEHLLEGWFFYNTRLFDVTTIERMNRHFQTLLQNIVVNPQVQISQIPLLTAEEQHQLLVTWNNTYTHCLSAHVHQLFEYQAENTPNAIAVISHPEQLTYQALNQRANQLAHHLQALGVGPEVIVGICIERSIEMVVGFLGILKAGGAYLPLDPAYPKERLTYILSDAQVKILVTQETQVRGDLQLFINNEQLRTIYLDTDWETIAKCSWEKPISFVTPENLAYVMYTSGSTGHPKGVMIEHCSLSNFIEVTKVQQEISQRDRILQFSSISFDTAIEEIYSCLTAGATLVLRDEQMLSGVGQFVQRCQDLQLTVLNLPTAYWHVLISELVTARLTLPKSVRLVLIGGEQALAEKVRLWQEYLGNYPQLFNVYGPTETTGVSTTYKLSSVTIRYDELSSDTPLPTVPIGRPIGNTLVYVLDKLLQPVPIGVAGELYVGGINVARGYLNRPELTKEKFILNPFCEESSTRLYKTGDLTRYLPDGNLEFLGRVDNQVKIRGFRVETGEIEAWLGKAPNVGEAVVVVTEEQPGNKRLVAYVVPNQMPLSVSSLRDFLKKKLPDYMLPAVFISLDALPLTPHGKLDYAALPTPEVSSFDPAVTLVSPRDNIELQLVHIWEKILNVHPIGVQSNFFELGGHSLLAIGLISQIQKQFDQELPLSILFRHPTIEQQAVFLREQKPEQTFSPLIPLQATGQQFPFFCVHPSGGGVLCYLDLAHQLGPEQPFYGLQSPALDSKQEPLASIEEMATTYIEALQTIQHQGPYYLGGWSLGGVVAFEMAQQLQASGHEIALLAIIDSYLDIPEKIDEVILSSHFATNLCASSGQTIPFPIEKLQQFDTEKQLAYILEQAQQSNVLSPEVSQQQIQQLFNIFKTNRQALVHYVPQPYAGKMTFFCASQPFEQANGDARQGWPELARGGIEIHEISGDHYTIVRSPQLANKLATLIAENTH